MKNNVVTSNDLRTEVNAGDFLMSFLNMGDFIRQFKCS